ncbi:MAG: hypothetical protein A2622_01485 [Bdellovibrionales bacterium RIFCSPHIGHO2_01_FULL_40_29]|nr:MAG: hypothetical protein A2622_01485 [Bdellovibrionales bacterium RIFCSPHIGHO2_01_FULL_40_29]OFZ33770.1 MAG: hypothetical protein A3D17_01905 [Bdellovibrionales bacterium RIFCSPHIGHO2_02_FULL_40_15]
MKNVGLNFVFFFFAMQSFSAGMPPLKSKSSLTKNVNFFSASDLNITQVKSNIKVKNGNFSSQNIYGLYVRQLAQVPVGQPCTSASIIYPNTGAGAASNTAVGTFVMRVIIDPSHEAEVGANFLYNMIYNTSQYIQTTYPSSPPGCSLPGCTWGSDTTLYNWCIHLGVIAPVSISSGFTTSNIVPSTKLASTTDYNYNLASSYEYLGPISCDDQQLTCSVASSQIQSF